MLVEGKNWVFLSKGDVNGKVFDLSRNTHMRTNSDCGSVHNIPKNGGANNINFFTQDFDLGNNTSKSSMNAHELSDELVQE